MDINRFTQKSQEALQAAQSLAVRHGHVEVDGEHLLLALLEQENGLVPRLVARLDPKLDRKTGTLIINGFWLEADAPVDDPAFAGALGKGLARFAAFVGARQTNVSAIQPQKLRNHLQKFL